MNDLHRIRDLLTRHLPRGTDWTLRVMEERSETIAFRQDVLDGVHRGRGRGAFLTLARNGGIGYAATADLGDAGLKAAADRARAWAEATASTTLPGIGPLPLPTLEAHYGRPPDQPWSGLEPAARVALVHDACTALGIDRRIVDWEAHAVWARVDSALLSSAGGLITQEFHYLAPGLSATANDGGESQRRSGGGWVGGRQGGIDQFGDLGFPDNARQVAEEAIALLSAPQCPAGTQDLVLTPSQMVLQIHESIGHPLELDRILGDERNYAGTSFVTPDLFGHYRYGSELLNVTFDPGIPEEVASYGFDDEGTPAERAYLIRAGILERPLGGALSQRRAGLPGTANARACHWTRPPIDRMANLNLEPGERSLDQLVGAVERGVLMDTNRSWSIDDSRNKFQFGCEYGRLIRDGELKGLVRNPNYRGLSAHFWRSLDGVGDAGTFRVLGVSNCGKGEPNQSVYVGHAAPACLFRGVEVFGGDD